MIRHLKPIPVHRSGQRLAPHLHVVAVIRNSSLRAGWVNSQAMQWGSQCDLSHRLCEAGRWTTRHLLAPQVITLLPESLAASLKQAMLAMPRASPSTAYGSKSMLPIYANRPAFEQAKAVRYQGLQQAPVVRLLGQEAPEQGCHRFPPSTRQYEALLALPGLETAARLGSKHED